MAYSLPCQKSTATTVHDAGGAWVYRDRAARSYVVYCVGVTASTSDSAYPLTADGLSLAAARADYLARMAKKRTA